MSAPARKRNGGPRGNPRSKLMYRGLNYVCARESCRRPFSVKPRKVGGTNVSKSAGLCPWCKELVAGGRGDLMDPALYAACQQAQAAEPKFAPSGRPNRKGTKSAHKYGRQTHEEYEAEALMRVKAGPPAIDAVVALAELSQRGDGGKRGGPNAKGGD